MKYSYYICDVFTDRQFGGNQLAVLPEASGLSDKQMQQIAREFNFSESTFVLPAQHGNTRNVRIFTPSAEMPFAGHPNVGTAFVLATVGDLEKFDQTTEIIFEEKAGLVPITVRKSDRGTLWCELKAPEKLSLATTVPVETLAAAVNLAASDIVTDTHLPQVVSVGLPFLVAELRDRDALQRARANLDEMESLAERGIDPFVHLYIHSGDEFDIRARMFAPLDGVAEDPATGSANCALAGLLTHHNKTESGNFEWRISQGVEMGRPSILDARTEKINGEVISTWIAGNCVMVAEGLIYID